MILRLLVFVALVSSSAFSQIATNQTSGPALDAYVTLTDPSGLGGIPLYIGQAIEFRGPTAGCSYYGETCIKRSNSTLTSIAVSSNTATVTCANVCGTWKGQRVLVTDASVDTDLNGGYTVTSTTDTTATTYTFTTANVADGTYTESTLQISTVHPLTTSPVWTITAFKYNASNYGISTLHASSAPALPAWRATLAWSDRAIYGGESSGSGALVWSAITSGTWATIDSTIWSAIIQ